MKSNKKEVGDATQKTFKRRSNISSSSNRMAYQASGKRSNEPIGCSFKATKCHHV